MYIYTHVLNNTSTDRSDTVFSAPPPPPPPPAPAPPPETPAPDTPARKFIHSSYCDFLYIVCMYVP